MVEIHRKVESLPTPNIPPKMVRFRSTRAYPDRAAGGAPLGVLQEEQEEESVASQIRYHIAAA